MDSERVYNACLELCHSELDTGSLCRALECRIRYYIVKQNVFDRHVISTCLLLDKMYLFFCIYPDLCTYFLSPFIYLSVQAF